MKKRILILAILYLAVVLLAYNGRSLGFDEASRGMAGAFYADLFSGIIGGHVNPGNFMAFVGDYQDHYKIVWDVAYFPPVQPLLIAISYLAFGISTRSTILVNALAAAMSLVLVYKITARVYGKTTILVPLLVGFGPAFFFYARSAYYDVPMTFFYLLASYLFLKWLDEPTLRRGLAVGLAIGAGFLTKYPAALALPAILLFIIITKRPLVKAGWPILAGFAALSVPWLAVQFAASGGNYVENWLFTGFNPAASGAPGLLLRLPEMASSTIAALSAGLSLPVAAIALAGILLSIPVFRTAEPEKKNKLIALWCWTFLYLLVFAALPITHLEMNRYRYLLPVMPLLLVMGVGPLVERFGIRKVSVLAVASLILTIAFFAPAFEAAQSIWVPAEWAGDYFLAISNGNKEPVKVLVQDPVLTLALRERDPQLKRFFVFYYPPTLNETEALLSGDSSSRSLKFFGLRSCGIGYATLINYGIPGEKRHPVASELLKDWRFDRLINGKDDASIEIYRSTNATGC